MDKKSLFPVRRLLVFIVVGFVVAFAIWRFISYLNGPSVSTQSSTPVIEEVEPAEVPPRNLTTKHFSLQYSADLDTVSDTSGNDKTALEVYRLVGSNTLGRRLLVITIKPWPTDGLEGESSYISRSRNKAAYSEQVLTLGGKEFTVLTETSTGAVTAFANDATRLAMIAYSVTTPGADAVNEFSELLESFNWQ